MTTRYAWLALASVPFAALLTAACSSDETSPPLDTNVDGGSDAVDGEATPPDAATDAGREAGPLVPPPPYDFTVKCTSDPCVTRLAARGGGHACVLLQGGSVRCWGSNDSGQLGTGNGDGGSLAKYESVPRQVLGIANATGITAAGSGITGTTCVVYGAGGSSGVGTRRRTARIPTPSRLQASGRSRSPSPARSHSPWERTIASGRGGRTTRRSSLERRPARMQGPRTHRLTRTASRARSSPLEAPRRTASSSRRAATSSRGEARPTSSVARAR